MRFVELFYDLTISKNSNDGGRIYEFWGIMPDGQFFFLSPKEVFEFINYDMKRDGDRVSREAKLALCQIMDLENFYSFNAPLYIEYETHKFLFETEVVMDEIIGFDYFRNPYVSIKGTCGRKCGDISHNYDDDEKSGYCLGFIPACNTEKIINTHSYAGNWANIYDYIVDIYKWMSQCKDLDVAINVHWICDAEEQVVSADSCDYGAFIIQGNKLTITAKDLGEIYLKYHK